MRNETPPAFPIRPVVPLEDPTVGHHPPKFKIMICSSATAVILRPTRSLQGRENSISPPIQAGAFQRVANTRKRIMYPYQTWQCCRAPIYCTMLFPPVPCLQSWSGCNFYPGCALSHGTFGTYLPQSADRQCRWVRLAGPYLTWEISSVRPSTARRAPAGPAVPMMPRSRPCIRYGRRPARWVPGTASLWQYSHRWRCGTCPATQLGVARPLY